MTVQGPVGTRPEPTVDASAEPTGDPAAREAHLTAPERVATRLREDVLDGALLPGARLREEELCARFGTGRHTIRAALRLLVDAGLVVHERNRGAHVRPLTRARIEETLAFRAVVELGGLRLALARGADLSPVERAVEALEALPEGTPWRRVIATHGRIHAEIVRAAGNERLLRAYCSCEDELQLLLAALRPDFSVRALARLHRTLVDDLRRGGDVAVAALTRDLEGSGRTAVLRALERSRGWREAGSPAAAPAGGGAW